MKHVGVSTVLLLLAGCNAEPSGEEATAPNKTEQKAAVKSPNAEPLNFTDAGVAPQELPAALDKMQVQVLLDRLGFSPGIIDGKMGQSLTLAVKGFQEANELTVSGKLDAQTLAAMRPLLTVKATRMVTIPADFAAGPFVPDFPKQTAEQAKLPALGYRSLMEALAERFHTDMPTLIALNSPDALIGPNRVIRVPNIADVEAPGAEYADRGWDKTLLSLAVSAKQPEGSQVVVDKSEGVLKVFDKDKRLIAQFPATMGSERDPLPIGTWKIQGVSRNPDFHYNPKLFWDVSDKKEAVLLKPGPNGPVGVVWIDLSKPHYGIHGTSEPQTIGRAESHGCIRLTNWDAARLAGMVKASMPAVFQN